MATVGQKGRACACRGSQAGRRGNGVSPYADTSGSTGARRGTGSFRRFGPCDATGGAYRSGVDRGIDSPHNTSPCCSAGSPR